MNTLVKKHTLLSVFVISLAGCATTSEQPRKPLSQEKGAGYGAVFHCDRGYGLSAHIEEESVRLFLPDGSLQVLREEQSDGQIYSDGLTIFRVEGGQATLTRNSRQYECQQHSRKSIWEGARYRGADIVAMGNEPGWKLEMSFRGDMVYSGDYGTVNFRVPTPRRKKLKPGVRVFQVNDGSRDMTVTIENTSCWDDMAGDLFDVKVTLLLDGRQLRGCGMVLHGM
ncbi:MAG: hypothetical protein ACR2PT_11415 [Endozoicomonas sp.]